MQLPYTAAALPTALLATVIVSNSIHAPILLSFALVQGNIAAWRKSEGDSVAPGDILAEVETDKATVEWEAQEEGFIAKIIMPAGEIQNRL